MLRLSTIATISIVSLLATASISDARSMLRSFSQVKPSLLAKQPKASSSNISETDLNSIQQVISARYTSKNQVLENASSTSRKFYEVKSLKLISFSDRKAQVEVEENIRGYDFRNSSYVSRQKSDISDNLDSGYTRNVFNLSLEKSAGKWKINTRSK